MYVTYDYRCTGCRKVKSKFVKKIDMDNVTCTCGEPMKRLPAGPKTHFKFADRNLK